MYLVKMIISDAGGKGFVIPIWNKRQERKAEMDIQQLRYFSAVAQLQNMTNAAELLHISQSTLSKQIAKLEADLGFPLFDRNGKKIILNKAGMRFFESGNLILREMEAAKGDIRFLMSSQDNRIRIGAAGVPDSFLMCMREFSKVHPEAEFSIQSRIEDAEHLNINDYDVLICPSEFRYEKLEGYPLYEEKYILAVPAESGLAKKKAFTTQMMKGQTVVFLRGEHMQAEFAYRICSALALELGGICFADSREMQRRLIMAAVACAFIPKSESESLRHDTAIRLIPVLDERFSRKMKICFLRTKHLSQLGAVFRDHVIRYYDLEG